MNGSLQYNSDCEGPVTLNDNAFELCAALVPEGDLLFHQLSAYDDYLADIERRRGYQAGFTLRLIVPFLMAYDATPGQIANFSVESIAFVPKAARPFERLAALGCPRSLISTSYEPYAVAVAELLGLPRDFVYCTSLAFSAEDLPGDEKRALRLAAKQIAGLPLVEFGQDGPSEAALSALRAIDRVVQDNLTLDVAAQIMRSVVPLGADGKLAALQQVVQATGISWHKQMYVGDSITDLKAFEHINSAGGLSVAFNGNRYALRAAKIACIGTTGLLLDALVAAHIVGGQENAIRLAERWVHLDTSERLSRVELSSLVEGDQDVDAVRHSVIAVVTNDNREDLLAQSARMRTRLRGVKVGRLG